MLNDENHHDTKRKWKIDKNIKHQGEKNRIELLIRECVAQVISIIF